MGEKVPVMVSTMDSLGVEEDEGTGAAVPVAFALTVAHALLVPLGVAEVEDVAKKVPVTHAEVVVEGVKMGHAEDVDVVDTVCVAEVVCVGEKVPVAEFEGVEVPVGGGVPVAVAKGELVAGVVPLAASAPEEDTVADTEGAGAEGVTVPVRSAVVEDVVDAEEVMVPVGVAEVDAVAEKEGVSVPDTLPQ